MANSKFTQVPVSNGQTRFNNAPVDILEFSRMTANPFHITTFNGGDIVPIRCFEVLPHDTFDVSLDFVIRQTTVLTPTMGQLDVDYYAFFVPNRIVNSSWVNVMGENSAGTWTSNPVSLAPLCKSDVQIPVGSLADHYGYPTQGVLSGALCQQMHDLKFRGFAFIYNEYFRDQNWQPPIPFSRLNVYNNFFQAGVTGPDNDSENYEIPAASVSDGSYGGGSILKALTGDGSVANSLTTDTSIAVQFSTLNALGGLLKANKRHDMFTSVLPSPQRGPDVTISASGSLPVITGVSHMSFLPSDSPGMSMAAKSGNQFVPERFNALGVYPGSLGSNGPVFAEIGDVSSPNTVAPVAPSNLYANLNGTALLSVNEIRMSSAIQRLYEVLARGGGRYRSIINSFFGLETENPFEDIPTCLGHFRRQLDLYQTAQTSASVDGETPQGNLSAFGYTSNGGHLFTKTFLEHGYVHIFAVVRHRNVYSSFLGKDNFRLSQLDFFSPTLANISEQPIYTYQINPFSDTPDGVFGYQEAWCEYRDEPNTVSGLMRTGIDGSLALWNYADDFNRGLVSADGAWLMSNTADVVDRTSAVTSAVQPQFKGLFNFYIDKQRPMPIYSVPGADII